MILEEFIPGFALARRADLPQREAVRIGALAAAFAPGQIGMNIVLAEMLKRQAVERLAPPPDSEPEVPADDVGTPGKPVDPPTDDGHRADAEQAKASAAEAKASADQAKAAIDDAKAAAAAAADAATEARESADAAKAAAEAAGASSQANASPAQSGAAAKSPATKK